MNKPRQERLLRRMAKDTLRVWESTCVLEDGPPVVCVALWGMRRGVTGPVFGITRAWEVRSAPEWNVVLEQLEEVLRP